VPVLVPVPVPVLARVWVRVSCPVMMSPDLSSVPLASVASEWPEAYWL